MPASTGEPATGPAEVAGPAKPASLDALVFAPEPPATRRERVVVAPDAIEATSFEPVPALAAPVTSSQPLQRTFEPAPGFNGFQGIAAASTPLPTPAAAPTGAAHQVLRAAAPVEMPLAPVQREPAVAAGSATGQIQRVLPENQAVDNNPEKPSAPAIDYDRMAEEVWPRIRRKLRIERERERGLPY
ncbi:MAG TPA: hypothetical protein PKI89_05925 [Tepidiformaceae bacterium]|nr:hypothetical protein [Tepidiformaceae bacterium]